MNKYNFKVTTIGVEERTVIANSLEEAQSFLSDYASVDLIHSEVPTKIEYEVYIDGSRYSSFNSCETFHATDDEDLVVEIAKFCKEKNIKLEHFEIAYKNGKEINATL